MKSVNYKGYIVHEDGQVIGLKGTVLKAGLISVGYLSIVICADGKYKTELIHRLVAKCFLPNPLNKRTVNHKDGNKLNNHVSNLEWATDKENINHAFKIGLSENTRKAMSKTMRKQVIDTKSGVTYESAKLAAEVKGINQNTLRKWLMGRGVNKTNLKYANHE